MIKIKIKPLFFVCLAITFSASSNSQQSTFSRYQIHGFRNITTKNGLSDNRVTAIEQDSSGYMWIGTEDGLNRYDGYVFITFKHQPGDPNTLSSGTIRGVKKFGTHFLYIATNGGGLNVYDQWTNTFSVFNKHTTNGILGSDLISDLEWDGNTDFLLSTMGAYVYNFNPKTKQVTPYKEINEYPGMQASIRQILVDKQKRIWLSSWGSGVYCYDPETKKMLHFYNTPNSISSGDISCVFLDRENNFWIGSRDSGITIYNEKDDRYTRLKYGDKESALSDNTINDIAEDKNGVVWIATQNGGLNAYDPVSKTFFVFQNNPNDLRSIISNTVNTLFIDNSGLLWIGTDKGISMLNTNEPKFTVFQTNSSAKNSISNNLINCITESGNGKIWIGTENGINIYDPIEKTIVKFPLALDSLIAKSITAILFLNENKIALGLYNLSVNIDLTDPEKIYPSEFNLPVIKYRIGYIMFLFYEKNKYHLGTWGSGLSVYDPELDSSYYYSDVPPNRTLQFSNNFLTSFCKSKDETIWVGSAVGGINVLFPDSSVYQFYLHDSDNPFSISNDKILSIYEDSKGTVWIGTNGGGLNAVRRNNKNELTFFVFTQKNGLPTNTIGPILEDTKGNLWIGTNAGLCRFTPPSELYDAKITDNDLLQIVKKINVDVKTYDESDGLPSNEILSCGYSASDGTLYFGTGNGMFAFHPENIPINNHKPPVYLQSFKVFEKEFLLDSLLNVKHEIKLSYDQNFISFEFAGLDFVNPSENQYAYKLEGVDKNWIYCGSRRFANYTNLEPGSYVFSVTASNNDEVWNETPTKIRLVISPPFWKTGWFRTSVILFLLFLIIYYIKWRERKFKKDNTILALKVTEATAEIRTQKEEIEAKNKDITDSINYARRIQEAILPPIKFVKEQFPELFIYYKPKDIVAGDFYWMEIAYKENEPGKKDKIVLFAAADCTGHGVPGAMVSVVCSNALNRTVKELGIIDPGKILDKVRELVIETFEKSESEVKDGMDISLCAFNTSTMELKWAGANNSLWLITKEGFKEYKPDKQPIGKHQGFLPFTTNIFQLDQGDSIYVFTDGFADQFGGENGKKFKYKPLQKLIVENNHQPMHKQEEILTGIFDQWKGALEQIDDVCIIGVKI